MRFLYPSSPPSGKKFQPTYPKGKSKSWKHGLHTLAIALLLVVTGVLSSNPKVYTFPSMLLPTRAASLPASLSEKDLSQISHYEDVLSPVQGIDDEVLEIVLDKYEKMPAQDYADTAILGDQTPKDVTLVVIQSEAYTNFNRFPGVTPSQDVNKVFEKYRNAGIGGQVSVPVVGGMTCDTEYEFLTGLHSLNMALVPYDTAIFTPQPSLAWDLRSIGYKVVGIHPYERTFFRRNQVYPLLGIDNFSSLETMHNPAMISGYVSDQQCFDYILAELAQNPQENKFIFNVTMQNHAPFTFKPAEDMVRLEGVPEEDLESLENLATGIRYSDAALEKFMAEIEAMDKHILVVFYGDHLFSKEHKIFEDPYFKEVPHRMYQTDYFIYDNKNPVSIEKDMSIVELSRYVKSMVMPLNNVDKFVLRNFSGPEKYTAATIRSTENSPQKNVWAYLSSLMNDPKQTAQVEHLFGRYYQSGNYKDGDEPVSTPSAVKPKGSSAAKP